MNLLTLPLVNPRHHIGKLKGFAYLLFEAFMRAYFDAYMKLLYPLCLVRMVNWNIVLVISIMDQLIISWRISDHHHLPFSYCRPLCSPPRQK